MINEYQQKVYEDISDDSLNAEYEPGQYVDTGQNHNLIKSCYKQIF